MATSEHEGLIQIPVGAFDVLDTSSPVHVDQTLDLINNANHLADQAGRVLINTVLATGYLSPATLTSTGQSKLIARFGPFPLTLHATPIVEGTGTHPFYRLRIRLAGASSAGHSVVFTVKVSAATDPVTVIATADEVRLFDTTSTTPGWIDYGTPEEHMLDIPYDLLERARGIRTTSDPTGTAAVETYEIMIDVWAYTAISTASQPQLYGLHVQEYLGL